MVKITKSNIKPQNRPTGLSYGFLTLIYESEVCYENNDSLVLY